MDWGLQNRLARIIKPETGRTVMLAVDHGYFLGPTSKLEDPRATIAPIIAYADALMPTRGVLRTSVDPKTQTPIVLRVSGGTSIIGPSLGRRVDHDDLRGGDPPERRGGRALDLRRNRLRAQYAHESRRPRERGGNVRHSGARRDGGRQGARETRRAIPFPELPRRRRARRALRENVLLRGIRKGGRRMSGARRHRGRAQARHDERRIPAHLRRDQPRRRRRRHGAQHMAVGASRRGDPGRARHRSRKGQRSRRRSSSSRI